MDDNRISANGRNQHSTWKAETHGASKLMETVKTFYWNDFGLMSSPGVTLPREKIIILVVGSDDGGKRSFVNLHFQESRRQLDINTSKKLSAVDELSVRDIAASMEPTPKSSLIAFNFPSSVGLQGRKDDPVLLSRVMKPLVEDADLVFIFFDSSGKTSPTKTLRPFEDLWKSHGAKFYMLLAQTQSDGNKERLEETFLQINRAAWNSPSVIRSGVIPKVWCIDLTTPNRDTMLQGVIQKSVENLVQESLSKLEKDCAQVIQTLEVKLAEKERANSRKESGGGICFFCSMIFLSFILFFTIPLVINLISLIIYIIWKLLIKETESESEEEVIRKKLHFARNALAQIPGMEKVLKMKSSEDDVYSVEVTRVIPCT